MFIEGIIDDCLISWGDFKRFQFDFHLDFSFHSYVISHCNNDDEILIKFEYFEFILTCFICSSLIKTLYFTSLML